MKPLSELAFEASGMLQTNEAKDPDRIALTNLFRAIAEYGHKVRERRKADGELSSKEVVTEEQSEQEDDSREMIMSK